MTLILGFVAGVIFGVVVVLYYLVRALWDSL